MSDQPDRWVDRLVGTCTSVLIGALALWGAVYIVRSIWPALAILAFAAVILGVAYHRFRQW